MKLKVSLGIVLGAMIGVLPGCVTQTKGQPVSINGTLYPTRISERSDPVVETSSQWSEVLIDGVWVRCTTRDCTDTTRAVLTRLNRVEPESDEPQEPDLLTPPEEPQEPDLLTPPPPGSERDAFGD